MNGPPFYRGVPPIGLPAHHVDNCTGGHRMAFTPEQRQAALGEGESPVAQRNRRLAARIAAGVDDLDLDGVIAYVRRAADANLDVPAPRAMQLVDLVDRQREHIGAGEPGIVWMAMRYALGRATYAVGEVVDAIVKHAADLPAPSRQVMADEIGRAIDLDAAGWDCDVQQWRRAVAALTQVPER